jgi:hypothetical protein
MKQDQDGHNLTQGKLSGAIALLGAACETLLVPEWFKAAAKIIDMAKEFEYTHR